MILLNGHVIKPTLFPDKTSQVWKIEKLPEHFCLESEIEWRFEEEAEFLWIAQLKALCDMTCINISLRLPYLPYGRQDKEINNHQTFALRVFAKLLNTLKFTEVICTDPHSEEASKLINHFQAEYPIDVICKSFLKTQSDLICYPDHGALRKYSSLLKGINFPYIYGKKLRDQLTGNILEYHLGTVLNLKDQKVFIVDDICDGGMTFILLAKALYEHGVKEVNLYVSHGIFSKGLGVLKEAGIKRIFTKEGEKI